jgi:hypothetical protein
MAAEFAVITVVLAAKCSLRGGAKFGRLEEFLSFLLIAPQPTLTIAIPSFERLRQIFDLDHLSEQCGSGVVATVGKQVRACRNELASNSQQHRHCDGFIVAVLGWNARDSMRANDVTEDLKFVANLV